jgi:hypothetical protein
MTFAEFRRTPMKKLQLMFAAIALLTLGASPGVSLPDIAPEAQQALKTFSKAALRAHMDFLADDLLEGRGTGARGQEIAAHYLAAQFEALGLEPAGDRNPEGQRTWFQQVPLREIRPDKQHSSMYLENAGQRQALPWGVDCLIAGNPLSESSDAQGQVVFAGYGVVAKNRNYDSYAGIDVHGKIVALLQGAPPSFPASERAHFSSGVIKFGEAAARGAVGVITLRTPQSEQLLPWSRSVIGAELPGMRWLDANGTPNDTFPQIRAAATLSVSGAEKLFAGESRTWQQVLDDQKAGTLKPFVLRKSASVHSASTHRQVNSPNVLAVLRGSDPQLRDQYVVYSAHTDHLGIGQPINGDSIYNGAVDDASGCTALIEMARAFSRLPKPPARSILFAGFTGEEKGLLGADYFAHQPTVPAAGLAVDLNMDGAAVFYTFRDFVPLGVEHTTMEPLIERDLNALGLKLSPDPMPEQVGFIRNDQYPFVKIGVPALSLQEGLEAKDPGVDGRHFLENWIGTRYHSPSDDMQQPLNFDATVEYMQIAFLIGYDVAQQRARPAWKPGDFFGDLYAKK